MDKIIEAIRTLYEANINPGAEAMKIIFDRIEQLELESSKKNPSQDKFIMTDDKIKDEIAMWIMRYLSESGKEDMKKVSLDSFYKFIKGLGGDEDLL